MLDGVGGCRSFRTVCKLSISLLCPFSDSLVIGTARRREVCIHQKDVQLKVTDCCLMISLLFILSSMTFTLTLENTNNHCTDLFMRNFFKAAFLFKCGLSLCS